MRQSLRRELRFLRVYAVTNSIVLTVIATAAFRQSTAPQKFAEITVQRMNVVDANGTLRLVISNKDRMHPGQMDGKVIDRPRPVAGFLFFNEEVKPGSGNIEIHKSDGSLVTAISITDTFQVQFADHVVTLNPHADLNWSTGYYVTFAPIGIRDLQNNSSTGATLPTQFNFITEPNNTDAGPLLVSATPSDNATNVDVGANI